MLSAIMLLTLTAQPVLAQTSPDPSTAGCDSSTASDASTPVFDGGDQPGCQGSDEVCDPEPGPDGLQHDCPSETDDSAGGSAPATQPPSEKPVVPERNPPGDIPDSQVFVTYTSPTGGYEVKIPEGWARTENGLDVAFADKLHIITVAITTAPAAPTAASVSVDTAPVIQQAGRAVEITRVKDVTLPAGPAVLRVYTLNSEPNPVTRKQYRLENTSFLLFNNGTVATITLSAPLGSDNVDDWRLISRSFKWQ